MFALRAWIRWWPHAYLSTRPSHHVTGLHWLVHYRGRFIHFAPRRPKGMPAAILDKLYYDGIIRRRDDPARHWRKVQGPEINLEPQTRYHWDRDDRFGPSTAG